MRLSAEIYWCTVSHNFNPRIPCGMRLGCVNTHRIRIQISIHASHTGCDLPTAFNILDADGFQSTHPMRDATSQGTFININESNFNPRIPCGMRQTCISAAACFNVFQSTHPMRDATKVQGCKAARHGDFNPRIPCGMRPI